jgi:hypothetical protein
LLDCAQAIEGAARVHAAALKSSFLRVISLRFISIFKW